MTQLVFINYFIVPLTGLYLFFRYQQEKLVFSAKMILIAAFFVGWNIPVTRGLAVVARKCQVTVVPDSGVYTLLALVASLIVYACAVLAVKYVRITFKVTEHDEK